MGKNGCYWWSWLTTRRASAKADSFLFILGFPHEERKTSFIEDRAQGSHLGCLFRNLSVDNQPANRPVHPFFRTLLSTAFNAHGTMASPDGSCARAHSSPSIELFLRYGIESLSRHLRQRVSSQALPGYCTYEHGFQTLKKRTQRVCAFRKAVSPCEQCIWAVSLRHAADYVVRPTAPWWGGGDELFCRHRSRAVR